MILKNANKKCMNYVIVSLILWNEEHMKAAEMFVLDDAYEK